MDFAAIQNLRRSVKAGHFSEPDPIIEPALAPKRIRKETIRRKILFGYIFINYLSSNLSDSLSKQVMKLNGTKRVSWIIFMMTSVMKITWKKM